VGTRIYGMTVAEFGLTRNFVSIGGAHGATGVHYAERGGYLAQVIGMMLVFAGAQAQADSSHSTVTVGLGDGEHQLGSGFALSIDGYSRSLGGDGKGFASRVVWGFPIGEHLPWILDIGVCSAFMTYDWTTTGTATTGAPLQQPQHEEKGGILGFALGLMVPLGVWAQLDAKVNYYLGGDREAEASLVGNLTNRFYAGGGAVYWFGTAGAQLVGGVRL
jgi:hypothetical protein